MTALLTLRRMHLGLTVLLGGILVSAPAYASAGQDSTDSSTAFYFLLALFLAAMIVGQGMKIRTNRQRHNLLTSATTVSCLEAAALPAGTMVSLSGQAQPTEPVWAPWTSEPVVCFRRERIYHYWEWVKSTRTSQGRSQGLWRRKSYVADTSQSPDGFMVLTDASGALAVEVSPDTAHDMEQIYRAVSSPEVDNPTRPQRNMLADVLGGRSGEVAIGECEEVYGLRLPAHLHVTGELTMVEGSTFVGVSDVLGYSISPQDPQIRLAQLRSSYTRSRVIVGVCAGGLLALGLYLSPLWDAAANLL